MEKYTFKRTDYFRLTKNIFKKHLSGTALLCSYSAVLESWRDWAGEDDRQKIWLDVIGERDDSVYTHFCLVNDN